MIIHFCNPGLDKTAADRCSQWDFWNWSASFDRIRKTRLDVVIRNICYHTHQSLKHFKYFLPVMVVTKIKTMQGSF